MEFTLKTTIQYDVYAATTFIFNIQALSLATNQSIISESLEITPNLPYKEYSLKGSKTRFIKLQAIEYIPFTITYQAQVDVSYKWIAKKKLLKNVSIYNLKHEIIPFLTPTRNCPSDKLMEFAFTIFGHITTDLEKTVAIDDWIFNNIKYVSGSSNANTTAYDTLNRKEGVCKDFAHLGIALCRSLNIPARYFTCYASNIYPPDIHACFEAYLGNKWILFDPTRLANLNQLVKIADGKDGSEIAVATLFGNAFCNSMNIECSLSNQESEIFDLSEDFFISY
ncbi:transglutaminase-like domain-containing protein [Flavobacterium sp. 7A]|uniref:transglutaminase-like domain-containing protein n=1 Tax=Flavobacterium sp. 7A TaxID=2940571 RepID=UPI0022266F48|nr:transglutaminase family protein [Flavobacterium sp. 7A]MCW2119090.1 transglutaminase-like putative cysteine protease [Flavobacterium sp. 7A]